jgi:hypothetical protein
MLITTKKVGTWYYRGFSITTFVPAAIDPTRLGQVASGFWPEAPSCPIQHVPMGIGNNCAGNGHHRVGIRKDGVDYNCRVSEWATGLNEYVSCAE